VNLVLPLLLAALASFPDAGAVARHDLHVSYGNAVVEDRAIVVRLRLFKDDLEAALGAELGVSILAMAATPEMDQVFLRYLDEHLSIDVDGSRLEPEILARGRTCWIGSRSGGTRSTTKPRLASPRSGSETPCSSSSSTTSGT
jgi:hypothetical protein